MITDPAAAGGLRLADDLPEPTPQHSECVIELRAFSINYGETILIKQRPEGWRPGQDVAGVVVKQAADGGSGPAQISISDFYSQAWNARIVGFVSPVPEETKGEDLAILAALVADGRLRPKIGLVLPWEQTADAFAALTNRSFRGKAVLTC